MSNRKLLRTLLRLQSLKITDFRLMHRDTELHLAVKPYKNGCRCPACGGAAGSCTRRPRSGGGRTWPSWACASCSGTPRRDPVPDPRARAGGDPLGAAPCPRHLPPGVAPLRTVSVHDPKGRG